MDDATISTGASGTLRNHTVLVTGAGRGIGRRIALAFARAGANVVCVSRTKSEIDSLAEEISISHGTSALAIAADVASLSDVTEIFQQAIQKFGHIDVLVNNAGIARFDSLQLPTFDFDIWSRVIDVNLRAPVNLIRHVLPDMLSRGKGTIISIGSRSAVANIPFMSAYSTSKTGLLRFHQCLEREISGSGVGNFYIQPGNVPTGLIHSEEIVNPEAAEVFPALWQMLKRTKEISTTPVDVVADACVRLATDQNSMLLSGLYIDVERGLDQILEDLRNEENCRIENEQLYRLKVDHL